MAGSISKFCERMRYWCEDANLGYDQSNRWDIRPGGECDCSSLVIFSLREAGFDTGSASYTGDLSYNLTKRGWSRIAFYSLSQVRAGDILLNDANHVAAVISGSGGSALLAQASIDENGHIIGGSAGDQSGRETNVRQVYIYSRGWNCILRWAGGGSSEDSSSSHILDVDGVLGTASVSEWQRQCGTPVDGVVTGQLRDCRHWFPALVAVSFDDDISALMRKVQSIVGVAGPTGIIARGTVAKLQGHLVLWGYDVGTNAIAGVIGTDTAMAIQRSLNDGRWSS